jgi:hypothetical protein
MAMTGAERLPIRTTKDTKGHETAQPAAVAFVSFVSFVVPDFGACGAPVHP